MRPLYQALLCSTILTGSAAFAQSSDPIEGVVRDDGTIYMCEQVFTPDEAAAMVATANFCPEEQRAIPDHQVPLGAVAFVADWEPYGIPPPPTPPQPSPPPPATSLDASISQVRSTLERHNFHVLMSEPRQ